jgi:hypothetical protein
MTRTTGLVLLTVMTLTGCVNTTIQEVRESTTGITVGESVVVLGRYHKRTGETEDHFVNCVGDKLDGGKDAIAVIEDEDFVDALFPWFEPRTAPLNTGDLPEIIGQPILARRLGQIGVRYLIWIEGTTERIDQSGSMTCSVTATGAGCFGFLSWEDDSSYEASIWDIKHGRAVGKISSDASGTSFVPAVVVPLPFIARVQTSACKSMADQLKNFIRKES